jgi:uridine kinase
VAAALAGVNAGPVLVAVDGIDGSGKSRFADALARECAAGGLPAVVVRVDDFRRPAELDGIAPDREADVYYRRYYDFDALDRHLDALAAAAAAPAAIVLEGVFVLRARRAASASASLIVLDVAEDVALERLRARDVARGRDPAEVQRRIRARYLPGQARYQAEYDPAGRADVVIDNTDWSRPRLVRRGSTRLPAAVEGAINHLLVSRI